MYSRMLDNIKDSMQSYGYVRLMVWWSGQKPKSSYNHGYSIISVTAFEHDLLLTSDSNRSPGWIEEEVNSDYNNWVDDYLEGKPCGFYEILGRFYFHGWTSGYYEPEYESEWELRHVKSRKATYDEVRDHDDNDFLKDSEIALMGENSWHKERISPYMERRQIINHYAWCLHSVHRGWWSVSSKMCLDDFAAMTDEQIKNWIFMVTLDIDSNGSDNEESGRELNNKETLSKAKKLHEHVDAVLAEHDELHSDPEQKSE